MRRPRTVYLDHAATTPTDPRVIEAMLPYFGEVYGNPSAIHRVGRAAERAVENARETIAGHLNCRPGEIIFTSCGSESDNLALRGVLLQAVAEGRPAHLVTSPVEHDAIGNTAAQLAALLQVPVTNVPVDAWGVVKPGDVTAACVAGTTLASIMTANNEVGTIQPIKAIAEAAHQHGTLVHTDAVQAAGQMALDVEALGLDLLSLSAHKFYGPKGIGVLYVRESIALASSQTGGAQENGRRAGTENVPLIVGMAKAFDLAYHEFEQHVSHYRQQRDRLIDGLLSRIPDSILTGHPDNRLPNNASFVFPGVDSNQLLMHLDLNGIAASSGSACKTGSPKPSAVLLSMGIEPDLALSSLRLTVGRQTSQKDIAYALEVIPEAVEKVRRVSAVRS